VPRFTVFVLYQILLFLSSFLCNTAGALPGLSNIVGFLSADHEIFVRFFLVFVRQITNDIIENVELSN
jgi:hypothetical protein